MQGVSNIPDSKNGRSEKYSQLMDISEVQARLSDDGWNGASYGSNDWNGSYGCYGSGEPAQSPQAPTL